MRRLQLLGKPIFPHRSDSKQKPTSNHDKSLEFQIESISVNESCLLNLPEGIILMILEYLDNESLSKLCLVNSFLYKTICNNFIYKNVKLSSKISLLKFNVLIHSEFHTVNMISHLSNDSENARFLTQSIDFINPQCQDSVLKYSKYYNNDRTNSSVIAGSFSYSNNLVPSTHTHNPTRSSSVKNNDDDKTLKSTDDKDKKPLLPNEKPALNKKTMEFFENLNKLEYKYSHYTYIELMLDIIDYLPNLTHITLSEVEPNFKIPLWYSVFNDGSKDFFRKIIKGQQSMNMNDLRTFQVSQKFLNNYEKKFYALQRFKTLEIKAISDPSRKNVPIVPLRSNMLCCFGIINELVIDNLIIDTESLDTPMEFLPLYIKKESNLLSSQKSLSQDDLYDLHSTYNKLTIKQCHIVPGNGILRLFNSYFQSVTDLTLSNITSKFDLLLCNCFPALKDLTIDCNSCCFTNESVVNDDYYYKEIDENQDLSDCDNESFTETLLDKPMQRILQAPPPTTAVVLSLNLNYISRATSDKNSAMMNKNPALITQSQSDFFHISRVPIFHYFYHYYKQLFERIPSRNININIVNIPFTNVFPLSPLKYWEKILNKILSNDQETLIAYHHTQLHQTSSNSSNINSENEETRNLQHQWDQSILNCMKEGLIKLKRKAEYNDLDINDLIEELDLDDKFNNFQNYQNYLDIPNVNLYCFLKQLSKFKSVKIQLLRKWLFCTPRTRYDWELLLKPVLNVDVPIEVRDRDGFIVYSYGTSLKEHKKKANSNIVAPTRI